MICKIKLPISKAVRLFLCGPVLPICWLNSLLSACCFAVFRYWHVFKEGFANYREGSSYFVLEFLQNWSWWLVADCSVSFVFFYYKLLLRISAVEIPLMSTMKNSHWKINLILLLPIDLLRILLVVSVCVSWHHKVSS